MWWKRLSEKSFDIAVKQYLMEHPDYCFIKFLGYGSYSRAYLIKEVSSENFFVLKCLRPKHRHHQKTLRKFNQEIHILKHLSLPYVPSIRETDALQSIPLEVLNKK